VPQGTVEKPCGTEGMPYGTGEKPRGLKTSGEWKIVVIIQQNDQPFL